MQNFPENILKYSQFSRTPTVRRPLMKNCNLVNDSNLSSVIEGFLRILESNIGFSYNDSNAE